METPVSRHETDNGPTVPEGQAVIDGRMDIAAALALLQAGAQPSEQGVIQPGMPAETRGYEAWPGKDLGASLLPPKLQYPDNAGKRARREDQAASGQPAQRARRSDTHLKGTDIPGDVSLLGSDQLRANRANLETKQKFLRKTSYPVIDVSNMLERGKTRRQLKEVETELDARGEHHFNMDDEELKKKVETRARVIPGDILNPRSLYDKVLRAGQLRKRRKAHGAEVARRHKLGGEGRPGNVNHREWNEDGTVGVHTYSTGQLQGTRDRVMHDLQDPTSPYVAAGYSRSNLEDLVSRIDHELEVRDPNNTSADDWLGQMRSASNLDQPEHLPPRAS